MKKRLFSIVLASIMAVSSFAIVASAAPDKYDLPIMQKAETILDDMATDANSYEATPTAPEKAPLELRDAQRDIMSAGVATFNGIDFNYATASDIWSAYITKIYDAATQTRVKKYMRLRYIQVNNIDATIKAAVETADAEFDTSSDTLAESNAKFDDYQDRVSEVYQDLNVETFWSTAGVSNEDFDAFVKQRLLNSTKNMLGIIFADCGAGAAPTSFETKYLIDFRSHDIEKKELALFFGKTLTSDLATGAFITNIKDYVRGGGGTNLADTKNKMSIVFKTAPADAVDGAYDFIGYLMNNAYAEKSDALKADVVKLFGTEETKGAIELAMDVVDADSSVENIWLNLFLRHHVQMSGANNTDFVTIEDGVYDSVRVTNDMAADFKAVGLEEYGLDGDNVFLNTSYFDVKSEIGYVSYSSGKLKVTHNSSYAVGAEYDDVLTLYRYEMVDGEKVKTYIESYNVTVVNPRRRTDGGNSGDSTNVYVGKTHKVEFVVPEGTLVEGNTIVPDGSNQTYRIIPKESCAIDKITVNGVEITDYTHDGTVATLVIKDIKEDQKIVVTLVKLLDDEQHYAYIIGYPDGEFKPQNNISREEVATIFFRLFTEEAREKYMTTKNSFNDVEEDRWSARAISTLANAGVLNGYENGDFRPTAPITRAEFATIAYRFYNMTHSGADNFDDIAGHWANAYINAVADAKWIEGYGDGTYRPQNLITRAEAVTIVNRILSRVVTVENICVGTVEFLDCDMSNWFYCAVVESANSHNYESERLEDGSEKWIEVTPNRDWTVYEK